MAKKILILDDDPLVLRSFEMALKRGKRTCNDKLAAFFKI